MKTRLDALLVARGLAATRERARALILAGQVRVDTPSSKAGTPLKAGTMVPDDAAVSLATPDHPYVGRGGLKLAHALDAFAIDPRGAHRPRRRRLDRRLHRRAAAARRDAGRRARRRPRPARLVAAHRSARRGPREDQRPDADRRPARARTRRASSISITDRRVVHLAAAGAAGARARCSRRTAGWSRSSSRSSRPDAKTSAPAASCAMPPSTRASWRGRGRGGAARLVHRGTTPVADRRR